MPVTCGPASQATQKRDLFGRPAVGDFVGSQGLYIDGLRQPQVRHPCAPDVFDSLVVSHQQRGIGDVGIVILFAPVKMTDSVFRECQNSSFWNTSMSIRRALYQVCSHSDH